MRDQFFTMRCVAQISTVASCVSNRFCPMFSEPEPLPLPRISTCPSLMLTCGPMVVAVTPPTESV